MAGKTVSLPAVSSKNDHEYSVRLIRWFLKPINVWPRSGISTLLDRVISEFAVLLSCFLILFTLSPYALCVFYDDQACVDLEMRDCGPLNYWIMGGLKYCLLLCHVDDIRRCVDHMETDWKIIKRRKDREVMLNSAKIGRVITLVCAFFMCGGTFSYNVIRGMTKSVRVVGNETIVTRVLPYIFHDKIWDARYSPAYEVAFVLQFLSSIVINSITAGSCGLAAVLVMHARGQLRILISWFDNFVDGNREEYDSADRRLAVIVNHHLRVFRFSTVVEDILNVVCFVEVVGSTFLMCILGYCGITEWSIGKRQNILSYCSSLFGITFNIFVYCYIGEKLSEQSIEIGQTAYMTEWYRLPGNTAVGLIMVMLRSRYAITINAGKIIRLSLATFTNVLTTSLTYFNLLRTMLQKTE